MRKAEEKWGSGIVEQVSLDLQAEFPNAKGFSARNLWFIKQWYFFYALQEGNVALIEDVESSIRVSGKIKNLHPVCRGEVVNVNYIKSIKRDDDGRIEIYLINLPTHPFHVGKQYESYYISFLPYSRRRENNKENRDDIPV